jgi:hypothetical protein
VTDESMERERAAGVAAPALPTGRARDVKCLVGAGVSFCRDA